MGFSKSKRQVSHVVKKREFSEVLGEYRDEIKKSQMFKELCQSLEAYRQHIVRVRCLALGSFHEEFSAKWQLALLMELLDYLNASNPLVSVYDPVFTEEDLKFVSQLERWSVDENLSAEWNEDSSRTLFFLPHAPLDLTELVLDKEQPKYWLANHFIAHTDRYTKVQLFEKYPLISKLINSLSATGPRRDQMASQDEFTTFVPRRKRKNRQAYQEPKLDYSRINSKFQKCELLQDFQQGDLLRNQPWVNSFSDLALHLID
ncbi:hypothetical protein ZYGR_0H03950 [Zygosaccharomyces rouxii]|uniref:ZYRO0B13046p n=2 Tax=Zygosaccharomyces rouxii TaxID=4956 RepID=C5DS16_ZYGRC|nr:uncharacterized protein ZYRO0B13046g [Zygosaccharomyces rouxii]KAH9199894.1 SRR1-domain-containing protein [Zygosaccharomyces rouxii]GAV47549.1 hypothetical protein ZYGR_0H03950 [Zygosaccharomyces rouxii]CAR26577.1 ZYRO0B13046p [Zygosaccharomyces rouxii]